jgi:ABC-type Fe3+/spermidine/putrescine transport system ATPase subunit
LGAWPIEAPKVGKMNSGDKVTVLLRPDAVDLSPDGPHRIQGHLVECSFRGNLLRVVIEAEHQIQLNFDLPARFQLPKVGEQLLLNFDPRKAFQVFNITT